MAFQSVPNTALIEVRCTQNLIPMEMTFYATKSGGYTQTDLDNLADAMDEWFATELLTELSNDLVYVETYVRGLNNVTDLESSNNDGAGAGGTAAEGQPNNVTLAIQRASGFTGRSARGRIYMCGIPADDMQANENKVKTAEITALVDALLTIIDYIITSGWIEVIVSRWFNNELRAQGVTYPISDWKVVDETADSQRGRLR